MAQNIPTSDRTPEYWRAHAEEARTRADEMGGFEGRGIMLEIAGLYDEMAVRAEREARHVTLLGGFASREVPDLQQAQQQQTQQRQVQQQQAQQQQTSPSDKKDDA
jgi:hypothetical protein